MKMWRGMCAVVTAIILFVGTAAGETKIPEASLDWFESKGITLGEASVAYPFMTEDAPVEESLLKQINDRILEDGKVTEYVSRVSQLISGGSMNVSWRGTVLGQVFSFELLAEGAVETAKPSSVWRTGNIDLRDGSEIIWEDLFSDQDRVREVIEAYLEEEVAPELSAHLMNSQLIPLPDLFRVHERGLILFYPIDQLSTLSDRAGAVLIPWDRVAPYLNLEEGSPAEMMGLASRLPWQEDVPEESIAALKASIAAAVSAGTFPGIPAKLGDSMQDLTDEWHLLIDPDVYALGRFFSLEGAEFRNVFLMTDYLTEGWENSLVDGIRVDTGSLYGLTVGTTKRETWRKVLGEPDHVVEMDAEQAEAYRTVPGFRDYYVFGEHRLQLHADGEGVLQSLILAE
ncbi:MAG: hypothetical protein IKE24_12720 [Clostridia bacterium]|nr:hypothetical protein [Clostridia bacterium]